MIVPMLVISLLENVSPNGSKALKSLTVLLEAIAQTEIYKQCIRIEGSRL